MPFTGDKKRAYMRQRYAENKERILAYHRGHYKANRERILTQQAGYAKAHPEVTRAATAKYRAKPETRQKDAE